MSWNILSHTKTTKTLTKTKFTIHTIFILYTISSLYIDLYYFFFFHFFFTLIFFDFAVANVFVACYLICNKCFGAICLSRVYHLLGNPNKIVFIFSIPFVFILFHHVTNFLPLFLLFYICLYYYYFYVYFILYNVVWPHGVFVCVLVFCCRSDSI